MEKESDGGRNKAPGPGGTLGTECGVQRGFFFLRSFAVCCVESALLSVSMADGKIHLT